MKKLAALAVLLTFSVVTTAQNGKPLVFVLSLFDPSDKIMEHEMAAARVEPPASLFKEDQAVLSDEEINKIFAAKPAFADEGKVTILRFGRWYGYWVGWSEDFSRLD